MDPNIVAALTDHDLDKYTLLEKVLELSRFFEILEDSQNKSGKSKLEFKIAVKPSLSMLLRRSDVGTYTDPFLVIHLLRLLLKRGYRNLAVVESQNLYGNWFENRGVVAVGARAGFFDGSIAETGQETMSRDIHVRGSGVEAQVPLVDLTYDTVLHDFGDPVGEIMVGKTWARADFRISFAKMKTHFYACYTLAIKNVYGCLPLQDKVRGYHCKGVTGLWTAHLIKAFPVDFSIADAFSAADGFVGVKMKAILAKPHTIIAGADIMAVDHLGATLMSVEPQKSNMYKYLADLIPARPYKVLGNAAPFKKWSKSPYFFALSCKIIEPYANIMDFMGSLSTGGYDECFPLARAEQGTLKRLVYFLTLPVNLLIDLGFFKLRIRRALFKRRLKKLKHKIPLVGNSETLLSALTFLGPEDLDRLIEIIERGINGEVEFCGHYMFINGREIAFASRLSTANLAAVDVFNYIEKNGLEAEKLAEEFRTIVRTYPEMFGGDGKYSYCYQ